MDSETSILLDSVTAHLHAAERLHLDAHPPTDNPDSKFDADLLYESLLLLSDAYSDLKPGMSLFIQSGVSKEDIIRLNLLVLRLSEFTHTLLTDVNRQTDSLQQLTVKHVSAESKSVQLRIQAINDMLMENESICHKAIRALNEVGAKCTVTTCLKCNKLKLR